jgi:hypothetical protein
MTEREKKLVEMGIIDMKLTPWCIIKKWERTRLILEVYKTDNATNYSIWEYGKWKRGREYLISNIDPKSKYILWHPLYIGDVMNWIWVNKWLSAYDSITHNDIQKIRHPNYSLPYHELPEEKQKSIFELLESIK